MAGVEKKRKKSKGTITFDEELVPKDVAKDLLTKGFSEHLKMDDNDKKEEQNEINNKNKHKRTRRGGKGKNNNEENLTTSKKEESKQTNQSSPDIDLFFKNKGDKSKDNEDEDTNHSKKFNHLEEEDMDITEQLPKKKPKRNKIKKNKLKNEIIDDSNYEIPNKDNNGDDGVAGKEKKDGNDIMETKGMDEEQIVQEEVSPHKTTATSESIRARKRRKHQELLKEKKLKADLQIQEKSLNYLSKWKYAKSEWKFEKLRQIWLQQNLFNEDKIPQKYWEMVLEYFNGCKGKSRDEILKEALKIIEEEQNGTEQQENNKILRARDIVQNLQE